MTKHWQWSLVKVSLQPECRYQLTFHFWQQVNVTKHWQWSLVKVSLQSECRYRLTFHFWQQVNVTKHQQWSLVKVSLQSECRYWLTFHFYQQVNVTKHQQWSRVHSFPSVREQLPDCQITHYGCVKVVPHTTFLPNTGALQLRKTDQQDRSKWYSRCLWRWCWR